ncbi:septum site-determining protein MinC [bacterium]|nr:MAG: septum site-determining protein MinC [bacterium]
MKGTKDGLLIIFPDNLAWNDLLKQLGEILDKDKSFWVGASTSVDLGHHKLDDTQITRLNEMLIKRYHLLLDAVYCRDEQTRASAERTGLKVGKTHPGSPRASVEHLGDIVQNSNVSMGNAIYLKQTIRSGQTVRFDGNVIIYGDTNPGSEIIASGDIVVIGSLRGIAHAGAKGDESCQITATNLRPTQLRIASYIGMSDDSQTTKSEITEYACITDGKIYIGNVRNKR